jgi:O-acetyl-ADP-ribose deacetylase (regulator of RNase III)
MIKYKKSDLLQATEDIIAHGCNCVGGFGSGVAGQIAQKWPEVRNAYLKQHNSHGWQLGFVQYVDVDNKIIANCGTQKEYYPRGVCHADYDAIKTVMEELKKYAECYSLSVAIPKIGAGLAGGNWDTIEGIVQEAFGDYPVTVYEL